jgi:hypothetical protein
MARTSAESGKYYGVYRGVVVDNADQTGAGRLKVKIPQILGNQSTDWIWPKETSSLKTDVPVKGQGVWVTFEGGDPAYPVWLGTFGKSKTSDRLVFVSPLSSTQDLSGISDLIVLKTLPDGTTGVDLMATLIALAEEVNGLRATASPSASMLNFMLLGM